MVDNQSRKQVPDSKNELLVSVGSNQHLMTGAAPYGDDSNKTYSQNEQIKSSGVNLNNLDGFVEDEMERNQFAEPGTAATFAGRES